jgi:hypothetical protein
MDLVFCCASTWVTKRRGERPEASQPNVWQTLRINGKEQQSLALRKTRKLV